MSSERLLEELLAEVRGLRERLDATALPTVLKPERAAQELSISESKLRQLIREGKLFTCLVGKAKMIPRSEIERLSAPARSAPKPRTSGGRPPQDRSSPKAEAAKLRAALKRG